jgi:hypothetical protein
MPEHEDFSSWRSRTLHKPMEADAQGCLLILCTIGAMLVVCFLLGLSMYTSKSVYRMQKDVAFILALPAIIVGVATFFVLAPVFYRQKTKGSPAVSASPDESGPGRNLLFDLNATRVAAVMADAQQMGFQPLESIGSTDSFQADVQRLARALGGATPHVLSPLRGSCRDIDCRVFELAVTGHPSGFVTQTAAAFAVPQGHDMSQMMALPPGLFAEPKVGGGHRVLIFPGWNWVIYLTPGRSMDAKQLATFVREWADVHGQTFHR